MGCSGLVTLVGDEVEHPLHRPVDDALAFHFHHVNLDGVLQSILPFGPVQTPWAAQRPLVADWAGVFPLSFPLIARLVRARFLEPACRRSTQRWRTSRANRTRSRA